MEVIDKKIAYAKKYIDFMNENQVDLVNDIIGVMGRGKLNKHSIVEFYNSSVDDVDKITNYDTSFPIDYLRHIEDIYPNAKEGNYIYDYTNNTMGELVNINDLFLKAFTNKTK